MPLGYDITLEQELEIVKLYSKKESIKSIVEKTGLCKESVRNKLRKHGVKINRSNKNNQKWTVNQSYFKQIDTNEKAYWLGFIYADGNVYQNASSYASVFNINLKSSDKYIIELIKKDMEYSGPIFTRKYKDDKYESAHGIAVCDKEFVDYLVNVGCIPRKSLTLKFPTVDQLPVKFIPHFIRGYFDGDGCVTKKDKNRISIFASMVGTLDMMENIREYLTDRGVKKIGIHKHKNQFCLVIGGMEELARYYSIIYAEKTDHFLARKHNIFVNCFNVYNIYKVYNGAQEYVTPFLTRIAKQLGKPQKFFKKLYENPKVDSEWRVEKLTFS
jgi:intein-encoded DNA endonuclease-like protein